MMYVSQIIMPYSLNLYSAMCRVYLSKTGRKKRRLVGLKDEKVVREGRGSLELMGHGGQGMGRASVVRWLDLFFF